MAGKADLLLEIGCEEIPSRFMEGALKQLERELDSLMEENRLGRGSIETFGTPRRLVALVRDLDSSQPDLVETVKGPPVNRAYDEAGNPTRALQGFLQGQKASLDSVEEETIKEAKYIVLRKPVKGRSTAILLPDLLPEVIKKLSFPRPMYWHSKEVRFARPIRWLLALYDNTALSFSYAGVEAGDETYGHRFLSPGPFSVKSVNHFFSLLEENYVVLDQDRRREMIREQLLQISAARGGLALIDENLLEEVIYLVEYPVAIQGHYDESYLDLPKEVLVTTMQYHQRYFPLADQSGEKLLPVFVGISNNLYHNNIRKGYAKVLQARLADARFFFDEDRKIPLEDYVEKLKSVVFLEQLGTIDQKRERLVSLTGKLGQALGLSQDKIESASRAAHLCKADLVTGMVKEFTELQGVMGREYAGLSGETEAVSMGIYEHYLPRFAGDLLPSGLEGAVVSLADRIDTLAGCFAIGMQPTGSQDPYALRRQAQGAVAILLETGFNLALEDYIDLGINAIAPALEINDENRERLKRDLYEFLIQRIRYIFQEEAISHDVIEAVLAVPFSSPASLKEKARVLEDYLQGPLLDDVITAYNRVANLARKASGSPVDENSLEESAEKELFREYMAVSSAMRDINDTAALLEELQRLKGPVDRFFDHVMVMVEDRQLRENRLNLLWNIKRLFNRVADFSKLQAP